MPEGVNETWLRIGVFAAVFAVLAGVELLRPRRALSADKGRRWLTNLSIVAIDSLVVRVMGALAVPVTAVGAAAGAHGLIGLNNFINMKKGGPGRNGGVGSSPTDKKTTHQTYTKSNPKTREVYSGRTSGSSTPEANIANRDASHHKTKEGFGPAILDKSSKNKAAIRGREQDLIDANGGAKNSGGTSGNKINSISRDNPKRDQYFQAADREFNNPQ